MNPQFDQVRTECYQQIRDCMKTGLQHYYQKHPNLLMDERSQEAIEVSVRGLEAIFAVLDQYQIVAK